MAAKLETSHNTGSDVVYLCCSICGDDGICKEGRFHCQKCSKYFCDSCVLTHNKFLKDHSITANGDNWPVPKTMDDTLESCEEHSTEKLTMFCEDHEKLICQLCLLYNHRNCCEVFRLADKIKSSGQRIKLAKMAKRTEKLKKRLEDVVKQGEQNIHTLQTSYECALEEILKFHRQINEKLDQLQQNTVRQLEELHSSLKISLENENKQCIEYISKLNGYSICGSEKTSSKRSFIMHRKCLDQIASADSFLKKLIKYGYIVFQYNTDLERFLDTCTELGNIIIDGNIPLENFYTNKIFGINKKSEYNVRSATDMSTCAITGICESADGKFVIADKENQCVKLLDQAFKLIDKLQLPTSPFLLFKTFPNEMALTLRQPGSVTQIHFLRVDKGKIVKLNKIELNTLCSIIASHQGDKFVTSGPAVCQYTMDGHLVKKLYYEQSRSFRGVGVSPDGNRIYVMDNGSGTGDLLTLTRDGAVTATLYDPLFRSSYIPCNIQVSSTGKVFAFGVIGVSQVDTDGKNVLKTTTMDIPYPGSVYFNEDTGNIIVGMLTNDNIIEFETEVS